MSSWLNGLVVSDGKFVRWGLVGGSRSGVWHALERYVLSLASSSVSLHASCHEVRSFASPHAPAMVFCPAKGPKQRDHELKYLKLWAKTNLSSLSWFFSGYFVMTTKIPNTIPIILLYKQDVTITKKSVAFFLVGTLCFWSCFQLY